MSMPNPAADAPWFLAIGVLLVVSVLAGSRLKRLPLSTAILYLGCGVLMGPAVFDLIDMDPYRPSYLLEKLAEIAVIVSLFTAGLKLRLPLSANEWRIAWRLASVAMLISIALIAVAGHFLLSLSWPAALLLAAILAPTDPVLASDVQVAEPGDKDQLRFALTGEAGLNDGTAFPFVMLALLLMQGDPSWASLGRWVAVDLIWASVVGLGIGFGLGWGVGRFVLYLRREHQEAIGLDNFLALGLIGLSYGLALQVHAYGFLAVFAAGLALRRIEHLASGEKTIAPEELTGDSEVLSADETKAPAVMTHALLSFNEQLERIGELALVLILGALLRWEFFSWPLVIMAVLIFTCIRPLSVYISLLGSRGVYSTQKRLIAWFGIRGLGSIYYLAFAMQQDLEPGLARELIVPVLSLILVSIFIHGISVTPLMQRYERWGRREEARQRAAHPGLEG